MKQPDDFDLAKPLAESINRSATTPEAEQARQLALGKISRRYAAYIVPAALAVLSNRATAAS